MNPLDRLEEVTSAAARDRRDRLDTLQAACDSESLRGLFPTLLGSSWDRNARLRHVGVEMLRRRKRRCVLRYDLEFEVQGEVRRVGLIGKVFKGAGGDPVRARMQWLYARGFASDASDDIAVPRVEAYVPELSLLLQEEIGGRAVKEYLASPDAAWALRRMASALAKLHRTPMPPERPWVLEDHLSRCHPAATTLGERTPELAGLVREILQGAAEWTRKYAAAPPALIHGDLHFGQVHVSSEKVWVIDLDASCVADPAADLGNALVFLRGKQHRLPSVEGLCDAFLREYFQHMPTPILDRVPLYEALTHLRRACKLTRLQEGNWRKKTRRYLEASLACLSGRDSAGLV